MRTANEPHAPTWETLPLPDAELRWQPHWLPPTEADELFAELHATIPWETHRIRIFGRVVDSPRLSCWIGDEGAHYTYSGARFAPHPWPSPLAALRARVEAACGTRFNSVLANLYRNGRDSMGWHSDDEPELGAQPAIASVSLGAERRFRLRRKRVRGAGRPPGDTRELALPHGSLLLMAGDTQRNYQHDLPRTHAATGARINLTFRWIAPRPTQSPAGPRR